MRDAALLARWMPGFGDPMQMPIDDFDKALVTLSEMDEREGGLRRG